jgi:hypothetical protein
LECSERPSVGVYLVGRPRTPDTRLRKPCCSVKPVRHISMFDPTLPGVSLVSMYGLGVYTPALPDVCVVARSSSVLMQAILLFVFTSYCPCDALQRGGREQAKIGRSRRTWRGARGLAVSTLVVSSVEPRVVGVLGTSECWSIPRGTSAHS